MAMITPTRLGLKYAPVPTLALEYEEDLGVVENDDGTRSLYVFKEEPAGKDKHARRVRKKLHVVELPQLHGRSEPLAVVRQLQKDNHKFLGPSVVKEQQLQRLLQQLVDHLPGADVRTAEPIAPATRVEGDTERHDTSSHAQHNAKEEEEDEGQLEESVMEDSVADASASLEVSRTDKDQADDQATGKQNSPASSNHRAGKFITQDDSDGDDTAENDHHEDDQAAASSPPKSTPLSDEDRDEAEEDAKKKKILKSESDASEEEDVQSEELEYFSEDGSDEDSF